jgi:hypothetical protein
MGSRVRTPRLGSPAVLVEESAEQVDPFDRSGRVEFSSGRYRDVKCDPTVRPALVVLSDVDIQHVL